jgi:ATP-dependent HslUV protease ATP-binding subunit HslU
LEEHLYDAPDALKSTSLNITKEIVQRKLNSIVKNRDLSRYIL